MNITNLPPQGTLQLLVVTAVCTAVLGALFKPFGEAIFKIILFPFKPICRTIYLLIAPRNILSIPYKCYKKSIARSHLSRIENPVGPPVQIPLEHAFAPLKLVSNVKREGVELFTMLSQSKRLILLGGPGSGKTTLMKSLLYAIVNKKCSGKLNELIPVFIVLRKLSNGNNSVKQAIIEALKEHQYPRSDRFVGAALKQGKMLIILDGLDEVGTNREFVIQQIINFCEEDSNQSNRNYIVVTCRETSYRSEDLRMVIPDVVRVEPFGNHHIRIFLQGWPMYKERSALNLYGMIQGDPQIREICRNPLLLTILAGLYLESDQFELPNSRELFYKSAVDELLVKRPSRRVIKQDFSENNKRRILERTSFQKLQTLNSDEDPEVFSREAIKDIAKEIIGGQVNIDGLIDELTIINGILKNVDTDTYTCAHRTFQEYFAAREATRILDIEGLLKIFKDRRDLTEILFFACSLIHNIPQLHRIAMWYIDRNDWYCAARCLLHMSESPGKQIVDTIINALCIQIKKGNFQIELELLSSLGQRTGGDFEVARSSFYRVVDSLVLHGEIRGIFALERVLSTQPEIALKVIPVLLAHPTEEWVRLAVRLLRDIDTDDALDRLVQLLSEKSGPLRNEAGIALAEILLTRQSHLLQRINLFPHASVDKDIWPFDNVIPSKIVLPIAGAVAETDYSTGNKAIDCAAAAFRKRRGLTNKFHFNERHWRKLNSHFKINTMKERIPRTILMLALGLMVLYSIFTLITYLIVTKQNIVLFVEPNFKFSVLPQKQVEMISNEADLLVKQIRIEYPPKPMGVNRVLPWNWNKRPCLPKTFEECYYQLNSLSFGIMTKSNLKCLAYVDTSGIPKQLKFGFFKLYKLVDSLALQVPSECIFYCGYRNKLIATGTLKRVMFILLLPSIIMLIRYRIKKLRMKSKKNYRRYNMPSMYTSGSFIISGVIVILFWLTFVSTFGNLTILMIYFYLMFLVMLIYICSITIPWPKNEYLNLIEVELSFQEIRNDTRSSNKW